jgi:hypothetical protein
MVRAWFSYQQWLSMVFRSNRAALVYAPFRVANGLFVRINSSDVLMLELAHFFFYKPLKSPIRHHEKFTFGYISIFLKSRTRD